MKMTNANVEPTERSSRATRRRSRGGQCCALSRRRSRPKAHTTTCSLVPVGRFSRRPRTAPKV